MMYRTPRKLIMAYNLGIASYDYLFIHGANVSGSLTDIIINMINKTDPT